MICIELLVKAETVVSERGGTGIKALSYHYQYYLGLNERRGDLMSPPSSDLLLPVELASDVAPEARRVLDAPIVHLIICTKRPPDITS